MMIRFPSGHALSVAALALGVFAGPALAGECPANQVKSGAVTSGPTKPQGVTDTVLGALDLAGESSVPVQGRTFRMRKLVIEPGGVVPNHSHADRPALIYIVQGTIKEYAANCGTPIIHKAGEVSRETKGVAHWWKNDSKSTVILISADILHEKDDPHVM